MEYVLDFPNQNKAANHLQEIDAPESSNWTVVDRLMLQLGSRAPQFAAAQCSFDDISYLKFVITNFNFQHGSFLD
jgi:hypothetical protein